MKRALFIFTIFLFNFVFTKTVFAAEEYLVKVRDAEAIVYKTASSSSTKLETLKADTIHSLLSVEKSGYYYKITTESGTTGYIKSSNVVAFIDFSSDLTDTTLACVTSLKSAGFYDETYYPYLCLIQMQHTNWVFKAIDTNLDWEASVTAESSCNSTSSSSVKSYISLSTDSLLEYYADYVNKTCKNGYSSTWYPASYLAVDYHMDPRNFLAEDYLFQFESLLYNDEMSNLYPDVVKGIIENAEFYKYNLDLDYDLTELISDAGAETNVNPTYLASRILLELGSGTTLSGLYTGSYTGYTGYYNFVNWGNTDTCATTYGATQCGLDYAVKMGWEGIAAALEGAASVISENYISLGQYTTYLQKYNVVPTVSSQLYTHQYQTNIEAPSAEAWTTYSSYKSSGELDNTFVFEIPVYDDMPVLTEGSYETDSDSSDDSGYSTASLKTIVISAGYTYSSSYISGFSIGTTVSKVISAIETEVGSGNIVVYDSSSNKVTSGAMKTGYTLKITNSSGENIITVVVYGDTSGDGEITALDLLQVQKNIVSLYTLSGAYKEAADTSKDGSVTALDLLQIQKDIVDLYTVEQ